MRTTEGHKVVTVREIPEELYHRLRRIAADEHLSANETYLSALTEYADKRLAPGEGVKRRKVTA